jgi:hypothetical protein
MLRGRPLQTRNGREGDQVWIWVWIVELSRRNEASSKKDDQLSLLHCWACYKTVKISFRIKPYPRKCKINLLDWQFEVSSQQSEAAWYKSPQGWPATILDPDNLIGSNPQDWKEKLEWSIRHCKATAMNPLQPQALNAKPYSLNVIETPGRGTQRRKYCRPSCPDRWWRWQRFTFFIRLRLDLQPRARRQVVKYCPSQGQEALSAQAHLEVNDLQVRATGDQGHCGRRESLSRLIEHLKNETNANCE